MNMEDLRVTLVQTNLFWEDRKKNLDHIEALIGDLSGTDLIVLPEMFTSGFSMRTEALAETMQGDVVKWMQTIAKKYNAVLCGSVMLKEKEKYYNRLLWCKPDGGILHYDKRHLFRMANEHEHYDAGQDKIFPEIKGWRISPLVCYDLRFPVWSRNRPPYFDLLLYVANWPDARRHPWKTLLTARAIENQCYVMGVNRIGKDGRDIEHAGDSCVIDPKGIWISKTVPYKESVETVLLSAAELHDFRTKFPVLKDADDFDWK